MLLLFSSLLSSFLTCYRSISFRIFAVKIMIYLCKRINEPCNRSAWHVCACEHCFNPISAFRRRVFILRCGVNYCFSLIIVTESLCVANNFNDAMNPCMSCILTDRHTHAHIWYAYVLIHTYEIWHVLICAAFSFCTRRSGPDNWIEIQ